MEVTMTRRRTTARRLSLEVGFEPRRGGQEVLADAYERLLPPMARPLPAIPSLSEEAHNAAGHRAVSEPVDHPDPRGD